MENTAAHLRLLKINHGAVRRLFKELTYYEKEEEELRNKMNFLQDENKSAAEITRAQEMFKETERVVPHIKSSLQVSLKKVCDIIYEHFSDVLQINDRKIQFSASHSEDTLKEVLSTHYEEICKEVDGLNETFGKVLLHIKQDALPVCTAAPSAPIPVTCVDI
ncbi:tubulin-specific chaperone a, putative [Plasmodium knowlesi strain H]|uniref:Tubulin-specific chaperone A n=3 Tax=Plasmodium knowlesi TaxID=5850 RepID=A0A5K1URV3_PLAKH|nr:tubulin-specific chaperone a, putative [Plasmodium knowlesi strain H]OTN66283.1 putative Tubulin-specific chaperone a [Plasmodium knowlesi]CAA9986310.1 tubulin-specific chaperone a, putative [Plasmodium knowlesi strain H]SBO25544.1 tubulin-specific chaperone a, putative [Plasmodium knowlesi strain H]SBO28294.1 tubulin-specific chaperone a, putative [Plasmodium knowlesi strain H]VVS75784.1 tubulin-specific chaperone a, putative [Plasmodium knowlesi strain H]|eukprot:XP_002257715.1 tubulin-specific chaperone a, putative [Plasmodium knowlesi strain H]